MRSIKQILKDLLDNQDELMLYLDQAGLLKEQDENFFEQLQGSNNERQTTKVD